MWKSTAQTSATGCHKASSAPLKRAATPQTLYLVLRPKRTLQHGRYLRRNLPCVHAMSDPLEDLTLPTAASQPDNTTTCESVLKPDPARKPGSKLRRKLLDGMHKPIGLVLFSAHVLGTAAALSDIPGAYCLPVLFGGALGTVFAALNRFCTVRLWNVPARPLRIIITGGTKGLGKALAREFLQQGDHVFITSRDQQSVQKTIQNLPTEVASESATLHGCACDVSDAASVSQMAAAATAKLGGIDIWINNAGYSGSFQPFLDATDEQIEQVVRTNLLGTLLCCQAAASSMQEQEQGGHIFNMDGAGADGFATPQYAAYGSTKAAIAQLMGSLHAELQESAVKVHTLSPGMMLTDLLLEGATVVNKQVFNILCEQPETVAAFLVPRIKSVVANGRQKSYIKYLTPASALYRLLTAPWRLGRFFDAQGRPVYPPEHERIRAKTTARLAARARSRSSGLAIAYSFSLALAVLLLVAEAGSVSASM